MQHLTQILSVIGAVATVASVASTFVPRGTVLGDWLAWFASMPIRHAPQKADK